MEYENVGFCGEGKTRVPGEKPLGAKERTNNKLNPDVAQMPGCELGSNWWEAGALYTALPSLPNKYYNKNNANIKLQKKQLIITNFVIMSCFL